MTRLITIIIIFSFLVGFFLSSPTFHIEEVELVGYDTELVNLDTLRGNNIITIENKESIFKDLKEDPYVNRVNLHREFPDKITLTVEYNNPEAAVIIDGKYTVFNQYNYIIAERLEINEYNVPVFKGVSYHFQGRKIIFSSEVDKVLTNLDLLNSEILESIKYINFEDRFINVNLENSGSIKLGSSDKINRKFIILDSLWQQQENNFAGLKYIDLSTPERPVIREE